MAASPTTAAYERWLIHFGHAAAGVYTVLGALILLLTRVDFGAEAEELLWMTVHAATGLLYLAVGLAGPLLTTTPVRARRYVLVLAPLFLAWVVGALLAGGSSAVLTDDIQVVLLHLVTGLAAAGLLVWGWSPLARPAPVRPDAPESS